MFDWFKKKSAGPDFSKLNSKAKVIEAANKGDLVPMMLMPSEFGGADIEANIVFVPVWAAQQKYQIDSGTILQMAQEGKIRKYSAKPDYKGESFVPSAVTVTAHDPANFTATINIW